MPARILLRDEKHADLMIRCGLLPKRWKPANKLHSVIIRFILAQWLDVSFEGWKTET